MSCRPRPIANVRRPSSPGPVFERSRTLDLEPIGLEERIRQALVRREPIWCTDLTAARLINGDGDGLAGVTLDRFDTLGVIYLRDARIGPGPLLELLRRLPIGLATLYLKDQATAAGRADDVERSRRLPRAPAWGHPQETVRVRENGLVFEVRPAIGTSVGLFLDMRVVRQWIRSTSAGKSVLNLFAYTCGFGVAASAGGASRVTNVDLSRTALDWGQRNYELNGLVPQAKDFIYGEARNWLNRFRRHGKVFDLVIADPPTFSRSAGHYFVAEKDFADLVGGCAAIVAPGGMLLAAANQASLHPATFAAALQQGLAQAGRRGKLVRQWHEPARDFPVAPGGFPYLKVFAMSLD